MIILFVCFVFGILIMSFVSYYYKDYEKEYDVDGLRPSPQSVIDSQRESPQSVVKENMLYKTGSYMVIGSWLIGSFLFVKTYL
jgi:hypothetical protein